MNYCALIADMVDSRLINDRNKVRNKVKKVVGKINSDYEEYLTAEFRIYAGDEVQGLLHQPSISYELIKKLNSYFSSVQLVFGVGIGEVTTEISDNPVTWELDGPVYHRAREMIKKAKRKKPSICYSFGPENHSAVSKADKLINSLLYFIESTINNRTKRQKEVVELYNKYTSQQKVAADLEIAQSTVSEILAKAFYSEVEQAEKNISRYLEYFNN